MTAISVAPPITRRIGTTARVHLANPWALIYTPAIITLGVFVTAAGRPAVAGGRDVADRAVPRGVPTTGYPQRKIAEH